MEDFPTFAPTPNPVTNALVALLKLDPNLITSDGLRVELGSNATVTVRWDGVAYLTLEEFQMVLDKATAAGAKITVHKD